MAGRDGRLDGVRAERRRNERKPASDLVAVPQRPVLLLQGQQRSAIAGPRIPSRILKHEQREQPPRLGFGRHQRHDRGRETDRR
jgi:hypothetical protein